MNRSDSCAVGGPPQGGGRLPACTCSPWLTTTVVAGPRTCQMPELSARCSGSISMDVNGRPPGIVQTDRDMHRAAFGLDPEELVSATCVVLDDSH